MKKSPLIGIVLAACIAGSQAQELTVEQANKLQEVGIGLSQQATVFEGLMKNKLTELALELQREGRLDSETSATEASGNVNSILTDLGKLYGEFTKTKVEYVLKAKNILTTEQKVFLLSQLTPNDSMPYETIEYLQPEIFDLPLNLSVEQEKKIVVLEAELLIKEVELERDVELTLLDLRTVLFSGEAQPEVVDPLIMNLGDLAAQSINNRVNFFIKSKDVLTLDQKRLLGHMIGLN